MKLNPALQKQFDNFYREAIQHDPGYSLLKDSIPEEDPKDPLYTSFDSKIEELVWQGFLLGLHASREHEEVWTVRCAHCGNGITETPEGHLLNHQRMEEQDWVWEFDDQQWACPDCALPGKK